MPSHPPSTDERASLAQPSQSSSSPECTSHLGFSLGIETGATMKDFASDSISATSGPPWFATCPLLCCLRLVIVSLLVVVAAGCSNGQEYDQVPAETSQQHGTPFAGDDQTPLIVFPQHEASLGTDRGGEYFAGQLILSPNPPMDGVRTLEGV